MKAPDPARVEMLVDEMRRDGLALAGAMWLGRADQIAVITDEIYADLAHRDRRVVNLASYFTGLARLAQPLTLADQSFLRAMCGRDAVYHDRLARRLIGRREMLATTPPARLFGLLPALTFYAGQGIDVLGQGDRQAGLHIAATVKVATFGPWDGAGGLN